MSKKELFKKILVVAKDLGYRAVNYVLTHKQELLEMGSAAIEFLIDLFG